MSVTGIFKNAKIVMPYRIIENGWVAVKNGVISEVGEGEINPTDVEVIDLGGLYLAPGFIELHSHGAAGSDFMDGTPQAYLNAANAMAECGVTTVYPTITTGSDESFSASMNAFETAIKSNEKGARLGGLHLEGPYFAYAMRGAQDPRFLRNPEPSEYMKILDRCPRIKRWSAAPELPGGLQLGQELRRRGIVAAMGHTDGLYEQLMQAYENGYTHMTHFYSAMSTIRRINAYRHGGAVELGYMVDEISLEIIADGKHLPPETLRQIFKNKSLDKISLITDSIRGAGMPDGSVVRLGSAADGQDCIIDDGVAKLPDFSAFAGSVATMPRLIRTVMSAAGVELTAAVRMVTANPSRVMGTQNLRGTLSAGLSADMTAFDENINVKLTVIDGETVYNNL